MSITKSAALESLSRCLGRKLTGEPMPMANLEATQPIPRYRTGPTDTDTGVFVYIGGAWRQVVGGNPWVDYSSLYHAEPSLTEQLQAGLDNGLRIDWARFKQASPILKGAGKTNFKYHANGDRIVRQVGPVEFAVATVRAGDLELAQ